MAEWRFGRGWTDKELEDRLSRLPAEPLNFPKSGAESQEGQNWRRYYSESVIALEQPGPPEKNGAFDLAWKAIREYQFSDPSIVVAHFHPKEQLRDRNMLLEIKVWGLHYLCGVRVTDVRDFSQDGRTQVGFRYDTLQGHLEVGSEWFVITKQHDTGEIWFRISASWRTGDFPNWWSRAGFELLGRHYQLRWHRRSYLRLRKIVGRGGSDLVPVPFGEKLIHTGAEIAESELWRSEISGKELVEWPPHNEVDTSSTSPGSHQVSDGPSQTNGRSRR